MFEDISRLPFYELLSVVLLCEKTHSIINFDVLLDEAQANFISIRQLICSSLYLVQHSHLQFEADFDWFRNKQNGNASLNSRVPKSCSLTPVPSTNKIDDDDDIKIIEEKRTGLPNINSKAAEALIHGKRRRTENGTTILPANSRPT
ncbi:hypothetical protein GQR58_014014 [Nymphon striatum]|nr:hypothetical protein GQR58_014014 [Nymphon striatum]